jgi:hypothetical protein
MPAAKGSAHTPLGPIIICCVETIARTDGDMAIFIVESHYENIWPN